MAPVKFCFLILLAEIIASQDVFVRTNNGVVRGSYQNVVDTNIKEYLGIPYAAPPIGSLRFRPPVSPQPWESYRDAKTPGHVCPQVNSNLVKLGLSMDEDCLFINVHTPSKDDANLSVIVYIHGGSFISGSGSFNDPSFLATKNVVVVTFNYRLGVLGFLSMGDHSAPGNYGMLDQVMALKWVRENIKHFGGNPNDVTLMGFSAGSGSVSLHLLSPLSRGLFHKTIQISGSSFFHWAARSPHDVTAPNSLKLAEKVNCSARAGHATADCLRKVNASVLLQSALSLARSPLDIVWAPVIETDYGFLPDTPKTIVEEGRSANVPVFLGFGRDESAMSVAALNGSDGGVDASVFRRGISELVDLLYPEHRLQVEEGLERTYLNSIDSSDTIAVREAYVQMLTDAYFSAPAVRESEELSRVPGRMPVYLYELNYRAENNPSPSWTGVTHTNGLLMYALGMPLVGSGRQTFRYSWQWTDRDREFSRHVMDMIVNFVQTGNPTPTHVAGLRWTPFTSSGKSYAVLDLNPQMHSDFRPHHMSFWNKELLDILDQPKTFPHMSASSTNTASIGAVLLLFLAVL